MDAPPDLSQDVLAKAALPTPRRWPAWQRWLPPALAIVAIGQLFVGLTQLFSPLLGHAGHSAGELTAGGSVEGIFGHVARETAAFNLAIGIGVLWVALHPERALGQLPVLVSLVLGLALVSALDLGRGQIGPVRLSTHLPVVLAAAIVFAMVRARPNAEPGNFPPRTSN